MAEAEWAGGAVRAGVYVVVVASGNNGYRLEMLTGQRYAYEASEKQHFRVNGVFGRLYSLVPPRVGNFRFFVKAEGQAPGRGGKQTVFDPDGKAAAHLEGDLGSWTEPPVTAPAAMQGRVWRLAGEELTNDLTVYFSPDEPSPYLTPEPAKVLTSLCTTCRPTASQGCGLGRRRSCCRA